jgi:NAD+ synthase (glutamine-hydrolysing)
VQKIRLYKINPIAELAKHQPDILLNLSASPFNYNQAKKRIDVVRKNASQFNIPVFYCNCVGAQNRTYF